MKSDEDPKHMIDDSDNNIKESDQLVIVEAVREEEESVDV